MAIVDVEALLTPIPGENPAGESLRYTPVYDEIQEARREDDILDFGEWQREPKKADWDRVIQTATEALSTRTKDLQIGVWLTEALLKKHGFQGLARGLEVLAGFLDRFWEHLYPEMEEDDLDFRAAPLEFLNERLSIAVRQVPLTDPGTTPGYSLLKYQESRQVGYESDIYDKYGSIDETKRTRREELIADGKITAEEFDGALNATSSPFYQQILADIRDALAWFKSLDEVMDSRFGMEAPRLADLRTALEECEDFVTRVLKERGVSEQTEENASEAAVDRQTLPPEQPEPDEVPGDAPKGETGQTSSSSSQAAAGFALLAQESISEQSLWSQALQQLQTDGLSGPLMQLLEASARAPSLREQSRLELLMAKLCLRADRPDLALPIVEKLNGLIEELNLERWESPKWIAEVLEALYQCLTRGENPDWDRARQIFEKICTLDVTKAVPYKPEP